MKILTLTTYQGYNYGASLQAYALQKYLQNKQHVAELIRFEPEYLMRHYAFWYVNPESKLARNCVTRMLYRVLKWAHRRTTLKRKRVFDDFNHGVLKETSRVWKSNEELMNNPPKADLYLVGSDQVWNVLYDAGQDPIFYLEFVREGKRASYAASFSMTDLPKAEFDRIQKSLKKFDAVAVREYHGKVLLDKMGINGTWVLDPTFLLSVNEWNQLVESTISLYTPQSFSDPYLLVYDFEGDERIREFAEAYAKERGLKIYAITDRFPLRYADQNFKNAGPVDFVRMIRNCKCFISNSFHGTVFSIMYHKDFYVFNRQKAKVNSRMESLLIVFDLKDRIVADGQKNFVPIDWDYVEHLKAHQIKISMDYLSKLGV